MTTQSLSDIHSQFDAALAHLPYLFPIGALLFSLLLLIVLSFLSGAYVPKLRIFTSLLPQFVILAYLFPRLGSSSPSSSYAMLQSDAFSTYVLFLITTCVLLCLLFQHFHTSPRSHEYYLLLLGIQLGAYFVVISTHWALIFLALELLSLPAYLLVVDKKSNTAQRQTASKYLVFGIFSSALMLYGLSWLYGFSGTLDFGSGQALKTLQQVPSLTLAIPFFMVFAGIFFKVSAVPFHFWTPDVYQVISYPLAAFFSVVPKIAGFTLLIRMLSQLAALPVIQTLQVILVLIAIVSMSYGNIIAIWQRDAKRLLAYSSIAQTGYILAGMTTLSPLGYAASLYYLSIYALMNIVAFLLFAYAEQLSETSDYTLWQGLGGKAPVLVVGISVVMLSLSGLPPSAGFIGKWYLGTALLEGFTSSQSSVLIVLVIALVLNTVISLFYYMRIPASMAFSAAPKAHPSALSSAAKVLTGLFSISLLLLGLWGFDKIFSYFLLLNP